MIFYVTRTGDVQKSNDGPHCITKKVQLNNYSDAQCMMYGRIHPKIANLPMSRGPCRYKYSERCMCIVYYDKFI